MIPIELRDQVSVLVNEGEFLRIAREHDLVDIDLEELLLLRLALGFEQNVVNRTFKAADDSFRSIFIHVLRLVVHHDLLLKLEVSLAED